MSSSNWTSFTPSCSISDVKTPCNSSSVIGPENWIYGTLLRLTRWYSIRLLNHLRPLLFARGEQDLVEAGSLSGSNLAADRKLFANNAK
jgi:hypothetical protein